MHVRDIMSPRPEVLSPGMPVRELEERFISHQVGGFPVLEHGKLVGLVTRSDLVRVLDLEHTIDDLIAERAESAGAPADSSQSRGARIGARLEAMTVADVMVRDVITVAPETPVEDAARAMIEARVHRLPVVEGDQLVGLVTGLDLARAIAEGRLRS
ncbi:MAG: CBS domain-containing protein [Myxococcota bacterium]